MGSSASTAELLQNLIGRYRPGAASLLELACGTGNVLEPLVGHYDLHGLDLSPAMLEFARRKVPEATLHLGDMREFALGRKFDVVVCMFDSINHLAELDDWRAVWRQAHRHLHPGGLLIFDMNTLAKLAAWAASPPYAQRFGEHLLVMTVTRRDPHRFPWLIEVFEHVGDDTYQRHQESLVESAFELAAVRESLRTCFRIERVFDPRRRRVGRSSERLFFVCRAAGADATTRAGSSGPVRVA
jgi:SAM-dependent methyltransferase